MDPRCLKVYRRYFYRHMQPDFLLILPLVSSMFLPKFISRFLPYFHRLSAKNVNLFHYVFILLFHTAEYVCSDNCYRESLILHVLADFNWFTALLLVTYRILSYIFLFTEYDVERATRNCFVYTSNLSLLSHVIENYKVFPSTLRRFLK